MWRGNPATRSKPLQVYLQRSIDRQTPPSLSCKTPTVALSQQSKAPSPSCKTPTVTLSIPRLVLNKTSRPPTSWRARNTNLINFPPQASTVNCPSNKHRQSEPYALPCTPRRPRIYTRQSSRIHVRTNTKNTSVVRGRTIESVQRVRQRSTSHKYLPDQNTSKLMLHLNDGLQSFFRER